MAVVSSEERNSDHHQVWRWEDIPVAECQSLGIFMLPALLGLDYPQAEMHRPQGRSRPLQVDRQTRAAPLSQVSLVVFPLPCEQAPLPPVFFQESGVCIFWSPQSRPGAPNVGPPPSLRDSMHNGGFHQCPSTWVHPLIQPPSGTILSISLGYDRETLPNQRRHSGRV